MSSAFGKKSKFLLKLFSLCFRKNKIKRIEAVAKLRNFAVRSDLTAQSKKLHLFPFIRDNRAKVFRSASEHINFRKLSFVHALNLRFILGNYSVKLIFGLFRYTVQFFQKFGF